MKFAVARSCSRSHPTQHARETAAIGALDGCLRSAYLSAYLATRVLLNQEQIDLHERLRGYRGVRPTSPKAL
jgi:hypothetical protein